MHHKLYVARRERGLYQRDIAKKVGMHEHTYHLKECGKRDFSLREAVMLAKLFDMTLDELFGEEKNQHDTKRTASDIPRQIS